MQLEPRPSQVDPGHLGLHGGRVRALFHGRPQAQIQARTQAAGATRPLAHALHGDVRQLQAIEANAGIEGWDARESRVHDSADAVQGDRGLGQVRRQDDAPRIAGLALLEGGVLVVGTHGAVQAQDAHAGALVCKRAQGCLGIANLAHTGQEDEYIGPAEIRAVTQALAQVRHAAHDLLADLLAPERRLVQGLHREHAPLGLEHLRLAQELPHRGGVQGRGQDDDLQVLADLALHAPRQGQGQVAVEVPLVELIEHDATDARQERIRQDPPQEDALGHGRDPRFLRDLLVEAHLVTHGLSHGLSALEGHAPSRRPGGQPARLQQHHRTKAGLLQGHRHPGRLAGARGRPQHQVWVAAQGRADLRQERVDGQGDRSLGHGVLAHIRKRAGQSTGTDLG